MQFNTLPREIAFLLVILTNKKALAGFFISLCYWFDIAELLSTTEFTLDLTSLTVDSILL